MRERWFSGGGRHPPWRSLFAFGSVGCASPGWRVSSAFRLPKPRTFTLSAVSSRRTFCELPKFLSPMFFCKIGVMLLLSSYRGLRIKRRSINKNAVPSMWLPLFSFGFVLSSLKAVNANILSGSAAVSLALLFDLCRKSDLTPRIIFHWKGGEDGKGRISNFSETETLKTRLQAQNGVTYGKS